MISKVHRFRTGPVTLSGIVWAHTDMYTALDRLTRTEISAEEADWNSYYSCPVCRGTVYLRSGQYRAPHFAHMPGEGTPECSNYHPGDYSVASWRSVARPAWLPAPSRPDLFFVSSPANAGSAWRLEVLLPKTSAMARVELHDSPRGVVRVDCSTFPASGRRYELKPKGSSYRLIVQQALDSQERQVLQTPLRGLVPLGFTFFRSIDDGGRRIPDNEPLTWGQEYYVLQHDLLATPVPSDLECMALGDAGGWIAFH